MDVVIMKRCYGLLGHSFDFDVFPAVAYKMLETQGRYFVLGGPKAKGAVVGGFAIGFYNGYGFAFEQPIFVHSKQQ